MKAKPKTKKAFVSIFAIFFSAIVVSTLTAMYVLLVKQIEMMNLDYSSFQAMYTVDSIFECVVFKESNLEDDDDETVFRASNSGNLGSCTAAGDLVWSQTPVESNGRARSVINFSLPTAQGDFCGVATIDRNIADTSGFSLPPDPNFISFSGQSRSCTAGNAKVVERLVEFYY